MADLRLFWWAPHRSIALLRPEWGANRWAWAHLTARSARPLHNFGDELSRTVVAGLTGSKVGWARPEAADLVAIGSVFELAARAPSRVAVWGTGLRADPGPDQARVLLSRVGPVVAVRGPRTRDALRLPPNTPLGDPGLLAYRHVCRSSRPRGAVVIPHFTHWNTASGRQQIARAARAGYHVVDPSRTPGHVLRRVAEATLVVSASLHGVVVAHSLGVPAELLRGQDSGEPVWKYSDYFGSLSLPLEWSSWEDLGATNSPRSILERRGDRAPEIQRRAEETGESLAVALRAWHRQRVRDHV